MTPSIFYSTLKHTPLSLENVTAVNYYVLYKKITVLESSYKAICLKGIKWATCIAICEFARTVISFMKKLTDIESK